MIFALALSTFKFTPDRLSILPDELLLYIIRYADADLYALSIVSKRFHFVVERTLYQSIRIVKELRKSHSHPLLLFMRTILVRNDLVSVVRSLELNSHQVVFEHRGKGSMVAVPRMQLENEIVRRTLAQPPHFAARTHFSLVAWIHVEQSQPHNLVGSRHRHAGNVSASGHPRSPLQLYVYERRATKFTRHQFGQVLGIMSRRSLAVDMIEPEVGMWPVLPANPVANNAWTSLDVTLLHEVNLGRLLILVLRLQNLIWTVWTNRRRPRPANNFDLLALQASLSILSDTLKTIRIIPEHGFYLHWRLDVITMERILELSAFNQLRFLEIPFNMLFGKREADGMVLAERLPRCLEHLNLVNSKDIKYDAQQWTTMGLLIITRRFLADVVNNNGGQWMLKTLTLSESDLLQQPPNAKASPETTEFHHELRNIFASLLVHSVEIEV
ncbi:uncharacterized protein RAG0_16021 [Rhynchosporium agropyri]|uniref:F-box domain-containing protein n=1 Tax=Rhynchosporium agropyri TaxID=914238 RepID=A0A1E1LNJ4_9HELO|nr:uncharacterized protein RAG0_16021 [Rhynchosporium agropyri]